MCWRQGKLQRGKLIFSENVHSLIKHILTRKWAKSEIINFVFCITPPTSKSTVSCYWKFVLGILGSLNAELEKKLLHLPIWCRILSSTLIIMSVTITLNGSLPRPSTSIFSGNIIIFIYANVAVIVNLNTKHGIFIFGTHTYIHTV